MRARSVVILGLSVLAAGMAAMLALRGVREGGGGGEAEVTAQEGRPAGRESAAPPVRSPETGSPAALFDDDPPGALRLEGQVIDREDRPVGEATVVIDANPPREVRTEADGSFAFDGLTPRTYRVAARAGEASAGPVAVRLGQRTEPVVLRIRAAGRIAVTVKSDAGAPVRGALVELRDLVSITAMTDEAGRATLGGVGPGWHVVKASAEGYAAAYRELPTTGDAGSDAALEISLRAGAAAAGVVVDAAGAPIEGARVLPEHLGHYGDHYDARYDAVITDAKGRWRLTGLPRATMRIRAYHLAHAPGASAPLVLADGDRTGVTIALPRGGRLRGRVTDAQGAPAPGAEVRLSADTMMSGQVRRVATDATGAFELAGLPRQIMYAVAADDGASSKMAAVDLAGAEPPPLQLVLEHGAEIAGVVVTGAGAPVPEARVHASPAGAGHELQNIENRLRGSATAVAGTDGRFRIAGLPPGSYLVRAIRPGSSSHLLAARLGAPVQTSAEARIVVDDLSAIAGRVAFPDGRPASPFAVQLGTAPARWFAAKDGAFRIDEVPAGTQFLRITGPDLVAHAMPEVSVDAQRETDLGTITVQPGRTVSGTVSDASGRPVAGAAVVIAIEIRGDGTSLVPYPRPGTIEAVTGADGRFSARGVGPSKHEIAADHEVAGRAPMTIIPAGTADVELALTLQRPGVVQGFIRMNGRPTEALVVLRAQGAPDSRITVRTGQDGSYRFDRVAPGKYMHLTLRERQSAIESSAGRTQGIEVAPGGVVNRDVDLSPEGVTLLVKLASANSAVRYGYGFVAVTDDPRARTMPLPRTISEGRLAAAQIQDFEVREGMFDEHQQIRFEHVRPGAVFLCASALRGDPKDPLVMAELQQRNTEWPLTCKWVDVPAAPVQQTLSIEVAPLPPPK